MWPPLTSMPFCSDRHKDVGDLKRTGQEREVQKGNGDLVMVRSILFFICLFCSDIAIVPPSISLFCFFLHLQKSIRGLMESLGFSLWNIHGPLAAPFMLTFSSIKGETLSCWRRGSSTGGNVCMCGRCSPPPLDGKRKCSSPCQGACLLFPDLKERQYRNGTFWEKGFGHTISFPTSVLASR